jgi:plasmid stabilization system protein ParE
MGFEIILHPKAVSDIEDAHIYYFSKGKQALKAFHKSLENAQAALKRNPFFELRYKDYRCLPLKKIPYMFHYIIDEKNKCVDIYALICAYQNPEIAWLK